MQAVGLPPRHLRSTGIELVLPVVLAIVAQADVWAPAPYNLGHRVGPAPVVSLLYVVTALALLWRKRYPLAVLAFIVTVDAVDYLTFGAPEGLGSLLPTVLAFYAVGRYARAGALIVAAPLALLGIAVHELTDPIFTLTGSNAVFYALVAGAWPVGHAFRRRAEHALQLQLRADDVAAEHEHLSQEAVRTERARIARELHDIVGHGLSVTVLQLTGVAALLDSDRVADAQERLAGTEQTARQTLTEMRRLLGLLDQSEDAALAPQPGLGQLDALIDQTRSAGATVELETAGDLSHLPPSLDLTAYRMLQESLTNVLKHARPPVCSVRVTCDLEQLVLEVRDAGLSASPRPPGRGLRGMQERVNVFDGTLEAGPVPTGGFAVRARFRMAAR